MSLIFDGRLVSNIQRPKFGVAKEWQQVTAVNFRAPGICYRVDPRWFVSSGRLAGPSH